MLFTNYKAENYRVLKAPIEDTPLNIDDWQELIPENSNILSWLAITKDKILAVYMADASNRVEIFDHGGKSQGSLPLPDFCTIGPINGSCYLEEFFFSVESFIEPATCYYYDPTSKEYSIYSKRESAFYSKDYVVEQKWVESKDRVKFPMYIVRREDTTLDGKNPTIINGYGCHGYSRMPFYMGAYKSWFERGGIYALASIRGGGEYGERWHRDGSLDKKQNTFNDFISAAEYLINEKYTNLTYLGAIGASNGGLMVGAVMAQRPDLFNTVMMEVPVLDLYRFHKFLIASRWVHEFGNPDKLEEFEWLKQWSPYHHIEGDVDYPNVLFVTANNDTRVHPMHAWKMAALMQSVAKNNIILLRTKYGAGHMSSGRVKDVVEDVAYELAFFSKHLGLKINN